MTWPTVLGLKKSSVSFSNHFHSCPLLLLLLLLWTYGRTDRNFLGLLLLHLISFIPGTVKATYRRPKELLNIQTCVRVKCCTPTSITALYSRLVDGEQDTL